MAYCPVTASIERFHREEDEATELQERADAAGLTVDQQWANEQGEIAEARYQAWLDSRED